MNALGQPILDLAELALAGLEGRQASQRIGTLMTSLAIGAHGLGPLLARLVATGTPAEPEAASMLVHADRINGLRRAAMQQVTGQLGALLAEEKIAALLLKGEGLAKLYPDPASRNCGDLDLLIAPGQWLRAVRLLAERGYEPCYVSLGPRDRLFWLAQGRLKDLTFAHPGGWMRTELHRRLFFGGIEPRARDLAAAFCPQVFGAEDPIPTPSPDAALAHYLLLHGAVSRWSALKHLVDLIPLFRALPPAELARIADCAEAAGTAPTVKAGLTLFSNLFGGDRLGLLRNWAEERAGSRAVTARVDLYVAALNGNPDRRRSRMTQLEPDLMLVDRLSWRLGLRGRAALSTSMRLVAAGLAQRREAGA